MTPRLVGESTVPRSNASLELSPLGAMRAAAWCRSHHSLLHQRSRTNGPTSRRARADGYAEREQRLSKEEAQAGPRNSISDIPGAY
ncbi:hypothetical protein HPB50_001157 [Hyalomma asiaticum]|uniref:Uncharacterized protein n=1 Tax=Hyalomma asiaticum TaxID=266040 RepID=A0ACB7TD07_HYAAI|nr:hypothetical protein HPB50_001157 [Hyalomma asiaticum]